MPNSGAHDDQMAPRLAVARKATTVSPMFGQQGHHPVAAADPEAAKAGRAARDLVREFGVGERRPLTGLRERHERDPIARCGRRPAPAPRS